MRGLLVGMGIKGPPGCQGVLRHLLVVMEYSMASWLAQNINGPPVWYGVLTGDLVSMEC